MRGQERNQTQSISHGPAPGRKTEYRFEAVVARLPAPGVDPRRSEGGGFSVSQGAQVATGPSSGFCVQTKEPLLPTLHWEPSP